MIAAVTGGRDLVITPELCRAFWYALEIRSLIRVLRHGDARGADRWAAGIAAHRGLVVEAWPADWERHGKSAGPIRNCAMLRGYRGGSDPHALQLAFGEKIAGREGVVDVLLAFPGGRGTADCIASAHRYGIPVVMLADGGV